MFSNIDPGIKKLFLRVLLIIIGLIVIGLAYFIYYTFFIFHISGLSPDPNKFPTSGTIIQVEFNKNIEAIGNKPSQIKISPDVDRSVSFKGNTLYIKFNLPLNTKELSVQLDNIKSVNGDNLSEEINYKIVYVDPKDQTKAQLNAALESTDRFEESYDLVKHLPIKTDQYYIDYDLPDDGYIQMPINIRMNFGAPNNSEQYVEYESKVIKYRKQAIRKLVELGFNNKDYIFIFRENIPLDPPAFELVDQYRAELSKD